MPIDGISGIGGTAEPPKSSAVQSLGGMDSDAFLKLLVAQMRYQNPMAPTDGAAMLQQTAQFTQVETLKQLATAQKELLSYHQASVASSLVGKEVTAVKDDGTEVTGTVDAIRFTSDGPVLRMGELELSLDATREIRLAGAGGATSE
ncbi:MAG TPA: flagellar hook capping FlgD N-terminal domain-containing protein [Egibacteraceae bacterium]|nr:flagellar hook capping FlgD N-terminal domain-containing protein [Egibacteraceae bacterium]